MFVIVHQIIGITGKDVLKSIKPPKIVKRLKVVNYCQATGERLSSRSPKFTAERKKRRINESKSFKISVKSSLTNLHIASFHGLLYHLT